MNKCLISLDIYCKLIKVVRAWLLYHNLHGLAANLYYTHLFGLE